MRKLPPLNAVKAFEAAARHVSFTRAADELCVTHGAVSRQVAQLETWFGIKLFRRAASQLTLTEAGRIYYREVTALFDRLALASMDMKQRAAPATLRVNAPPTFAMRWLISRSSHFQRQRPDVELHLTTSLDPVHADGNSVDVVIRGDQSDIPGWLRCPFITEWIAPVCHVDLLANGRLSVPDDLRKHRLITYLTEPYGWDQWFKEVKGTMAAAQETQRYEQMYFALQAVQDKLGIGMLPLFLITDELIAGKLCLPFGSLGLRRREYCCFYRSESEQWSVIAEFRDWLMAQGEETERVTQAFTNGLGWQL